MTYGTDFVYNIAEPVEPKGMAGFSVCSVIRGAGLGAESFVKDKSRTKVNDYVPTGLMLGTIILLTVASFAGRY